MYNEIIVLGVAVSLLFAELTGLSPAGIIVPGYIALSLHSPGRVAYTLALVLLTQGAARLLTRVMILYGRRRFAVMVLLSFCINLLFLRTGLLPYDPGAIGVLVPGIMAQEFERQGIAKSLLSLVSVVSILALFMLWRGVPVLPW